MNRLAALRVSSVFIAVIAASAGANAQSPAPSGNVIHIPLVVERNARFGTYKANINIGMGSLPPLPMTFDTASEGLHVFAAAKLDRSGSGVSCSEKPVSFTVGNPGRVTYAGVMCSAPLHFGGLTTPAVPIAYLTSAKCAANYPQCKIPSLESPQAHGGVYGIFGAGITGAMPVINPILALPSPYGSVYSIRLTPAGGDLALGDPASSGAVRFPLTAANGNGARWQNGRACIFVNDVPTATCLGISFDTGNGVAWIRDSDTGSIPQRDGTVSPATRIGFAPSGATAPATSITAGMSYGDKIKIETTVSRPLTNTGIRAFFDRVVTYDAVHGIISVAPVK